MPTKDINNPTDNREEQIIKILRKKNTGFHMILLVSENATPLQIRQQAFQKFNEIPKDFSDPF